MKDMLSLMLIQKMRNHNKMYISYYIGDSPQRVYSKLSLHGNMPLVSEVHYRSKYSSTAQPLYVGSFSWNLGS